MLNLYVLTNDDIVELYKSIDMTLQFLPYAALETHICDFEIKTSSKRMETFFSL